MRAFMGELHELLEAHPGVDVVQNSREQLACLESVVRVRQAIEQLDAAERARRQ